VPCYFLSRETAPPDQLDSGRKMKPKIEMNLKEIGQRLKQVRKSLGLTLVDVGKSTGASVSAISEIEAGIKKPSAVYLSGLAHEYQVNLNWVLTGKGASFSPDIAFDLNYGEDNEIVDELIYCLTKIKEGRYQLLSAYLNLKKDKEYGPIIKAGLEKRGK